MVWASGAIIEINPDAGSFFIKKSASALIFCSGLHVLIKMSEVMAETKACLLSFRSLVFLG
ncbi:hypothetical protein (plasmid) [Vibrio vulnificus YJ016]|uniref:Uncharacterized protein n=1 Tax=Vibrio vulnificus (strain YJ016) TaxID=196600 RepID=Q7MBP0_VIBVY|nr:hypothetical protein [Vibrio vulnificus YJ016]